LRISDYAEIIELMKKLNLSSVNTTQDSLQDNDQSLTDQYSHNQDRYETAVDENNQMIHNQESVSRFETNDSGLAIKPTHSKEKDIQMQKKQKKLFTFACIIAIVAGIGTGFGGFKLKSSNSGLGGSNVPVQQVVEGQIKNGDVFGMQDSDTFTDEAVGYLQAGGLNGEGSHRLLRPGGESQTVYLTSTVTDLDLLVGSEIKVWGETYQGQKVGWLMDVGKVEVIEVEGQAPFEEEL